MKVSFLSPDQKELVALQKEYLEDLFGLKEAIMYLKNTKKRESQK